MTQYVETPTHRTRVLDSGTEIDAMSPDEVESLIETDGDHGNG